MFRDIERFDRQVLPIHRLRACWRTEGVDQRLCLISGRKPAQPMFGHGGGGIPEGQVDRAALVDSQSPVPDLKPAGSIERRPSRHATS